VIVIIMENTTFEFQPFEPFKNTNFAQIGDYSEFIEKQGDFLKYRDNIKEIEVDITYSYKKKVYQALFKNKNNQIFKPKNSDFKSKTWEILIQHIEIELRREEFSKFVGITKRKALLNNIHHKGEKIFGNMNR